MTNDYRNTKYCPCLTDLSSKKKKIKEDILKKYPKAKDMHPYVSNNSSSFKDDFMEAYNKKCSYCGVSTKIIGRKQFEIDHLIPKSSDCFKGKTTAGEMDNLVLACYDCNRSKGDFELQEINDYCKINPDKAGIRQTFFRDAEYYIRICEDFSNDASVKAFYQRVGLYRQIHRLDYLLINMIGFRDENEANLLLYKELTKAIEALKEKRK